MRRVCAKKLRIKWPNLCHKRQFGAEITDKRRRQNVKYEGRGVSKSDSMRRQNVIFEARLSKTVAQKIDKPRSKTSIWGLVNEVEDLHSLTDRLG